MPEDSAPDRTRAAPEAASAQADILRRKIAATGGRRGGLPEFAPRAVSRAIGRAAQALYDVPAHLDEGTTAILPRDDLLAGLPEPVLTYLLTPPAGHGDAGPGLVWLDGALINGLIEVMTRAPDDQVYREIRPVTAIDAALCAGFWGPMLGHLPGEFRRLHAAEGGGGGSGEPPPLEPGDAETDTRRLGFLLNEGPFGVVSGRLVFQGGLRGGAFGLALPLPLWAEPAADHDPAARARWTGALAARVRRAPMELLAVLDRVQMPLARVLALRPGETLPLSPGALSAVELAAVDGTVLLDGRLGQARGRKAVRPSGPPRPRAPGELSPLPAPAPGDGDSLPPMTAPPPPSAEDASQAAPGPAPGPLQQAGGPSPVPEAPAGGAA